MFFSSFRQAVTVKPSAGPSLCVRAEEWKIKAIDRSNEPREKTECDGHTTVKIKRMAHSSRVRHLFIWRLSVLLLLSWKGEHSQCLETLQTSKKQSISAHTHGHRVVLFFRLRPLPFYVYLFLLYSCFIEFVIVASLFPRQSRAECRPSRVNFIGTSHWICVHLCLNHSDVCFHFISVSLSFHFRSEILNVPGFKKNNKILSIFQDSSRALISV